MVRPEFDPVNLFYSSQPEPQQQELSEKPEPQPTPRVPRRPRPTETQDVAEPETEPAPEPNSQDTTPSLAPMEESAQANTIAFLPDAVDLPHRDDSEWLTLAEQAPPHASQCRLVLISDRLEGEPNHRLGLTESTSSSGVSTWTVHSRPLSGRRDDETEQPKLPVAEFSWEEGRLKFQWSRASDDRLQVALRNSLLNVRVGDEEKLLQLRRPLKVPSLTLDLSKRSLQMPLEIPHLPPVEKLRLQLTNVDFRGVEHQLDEGQREVAIGQKLPVFVTTSPGARFQIWAASVGDELAFRAEGHYWLGSTTPIEFRKDQVERQMKAFMRSGQRGQGLAALQAVAKLGDTIHEQAPFHYRIYLPFEFEGVALEVVLLEAVGREVLTAEDQNPTSPVDVVADAQRREPVPSEADRKVARESLAAEYRATYQEANDRASQRRLAATLLERASDAADDPARQYEMFRLARVILIQAGDLARALDTADRTGQVFAADRVALHAAVVRAAASASSFSERPSVVVEKILSVIDNAILDENHDLAIELLALAKTLQENSPNTRHREEIEQRDAFLEAAQRLAAEEAKLQSNPDDTEAHLRVGRLALRQGRSWDDSLSFLSKGGDDPLADTARTDRSNPTGSADQVALGDRWYDLGQSEDALRLRFKQRAAKWYSEALPRLQGFTKTKVETRLESLEANDAIQLENAIPTSKDEQPSVVGSWKWFSGTHATFHPNGTLVLKDGASVRTWKWTFDSEKNVVQVLKPNGELTDEAKIVNGGKRLEGVIMGGRRKGEPMWAERID